MDRFGAFWCILVPCPPACEIIGLFGCEIVWGHQRTQDKAKTNYPGLAIDCYWPGHKNQGTCRAKFAQQGSVETSSIYGILRRDRDCQDLPRTLLCQEHSTASHRPIIVPSSHRPTSWGRWLLCACFDAEGEPITNSPGQGRNCAQNSNRDNLHRTHPNSGSNALDGTLDDPTQWQALDNARLTVSLYSSGQDRLVWSGFIEDASRWRPTLLFDPQVISTPLYPTPILTIM